MRSDAGRLRALIDGMRAAHARGENVMAYAREIIGADGPARNTVAATLIAYDLQAGTYVADARHDPTYTRRWGEQIGQVVGALLEPGASMLEVGCGEATTLAAVIEALGGRSGPAFGFDLSWSRVAEGLRWLTERGVGARLFVGDLFEIPFAANSVDVVYSSHSLEPNGGREVAAIAELLRVARRHVVLVEPAYEFAPEVAQRRMEAHGYVRNLRQAAEACGATVVEHRLLELSSNPLNPSGVLVLAKPASPRLPASEVRWQCPITGTSLIDWGDVFASPATGLVYPVVRGIPMLRAEHAIVASTLVADR